MQKITVAVALIANATLTFYVKWFISFYAMLAFFRNESVVLLAKKGL
jgi:hypothetical protein